MTRRIRLLFAVLLVLSQPVTASGQPETPLAVREYVWRYNPAHEPAWLQGKGRELVGAAGRGWEACGIRFVYQGETGQDPGVRDGVNVIGWDPSLGRSQRGITRGVIRKRDGRAMERDVAFHPDRREFMLHPRLLRKVVAHELGHVVGLGHAGNCADVMSFGSNCSQVQPEELPIMPTENDLARCRNLYGE